MKIIKTIALSTLLGASLPSLAADGDAYTITGTGFGTNISSGNQVFLGGAGGTLESIANGTNVRTTDTTGLLGASWTYPGAHGATVSNVRSYDGTKSLLFDTLNGAAYQFGVTYDTGGAYKSIYARAIIYLDTTLDTSSNLLQLKTVRFSGGPGKCGGGISDGDTPDTYLTQFWGGSGAYFPRAGGTGGCSGSNITDLGTLYLTSGVALIPGRWNLVELLFTPDSSAGATDGTMQVRSTDLSNNSVTGSDTFSGRKFWDAVNSGNPFRYIVYQFYHGNYPETFTGTMRTFLDRDVYFAWNASSATAPKWVQLCDAANTASFTSSTKCVVQKWNSWSSTSIGVTVNKGAHADLNNKYFYVMDGINSFINTTGIAYNPSSGCSP
jgi:hypothetical protein